MKLPFTLSLAALLLAACTVGPDFLKPDLAGGDDWKQTRATAGARLPDDWWRLYNDRELDRLVKRALDANNDLAAARARVETSRALVGLDRARMFPRLDLTGSAGYARRSQEATVGNLPAGFTIDLTDTNYRGSFDLAYDLDLWGRNRRALEASTADADAAAALYDAQRLGIATEVARQYFLLRGLDAQEVVLLETIESRQETLELQQNKADAGLIDGLSTSQARTELELARNDLAQVERQRGAAEHALAVLCGTRPSDFDLPAGKMTSTLPKILAGTPAEVLNRRPDVRAAEEELRAANARIGVAQAGFYPDFSLGGSAGYESLGAENFLDWENRILSIGTNLAAPIFDAGSNRATFAAAVSRRDEALARYRNALLVALREVEDSIADLKGLARSRTALEKALASARDTRRISQERYDKGLSSYLEVVEAGRTVLRVELVLAQIDSQQRITLAALAKALGGGWQGK
ncbi:MAG: efflux transporter outer membrane subunit [Luteolibacter sp.]